MNELSFRQIFRRLDNPPPFPLAQDEFDRSVARISAGPWYPTPAIALRAATPVNLLPDLQRVQEWGRWEAWSRKEYGMLEKRFRDLGREEYLFVRGPEGYQATSLPYGEEAIHIFSDRKWRECVLHGRQIWNRAGLDAFSHAEVTTGATTSAHRTEDRSYGF